MQNAADNFIIYVTIVWVRCENDNDDDVDDGSTVYRNVIKMNEVWTLFL